MNLSPDKDFTLADRYTATDGEVLVTGIQALTRVPFDQLRADRAAGLRTKAFISGYQGSPLGGYDRELLSQAKLCDEYGVVVRPGLNEELGATAVAGSQVVSTLDSVNVDGVVGVWYGKAPGLERAGDAIRHANFAGTSPKGGVLALVGDDPACKSSTVPSRSDNIVASLGFPLLDAGTMQDLLDLGRHAIELSRRAGLWCGLKIVTSVADGSGLANVDPSRLSIVQPEYLVNGKPFVPLLSGFTAAPTSAIQEAEIFGPRIELARRYIQANQLNQRVIDTASPWLGIIASGYTAEVVRQALRVLGLDPANAAQHGVALLKLRAVHPFDGDSVREFARRCETVLVVEEKTGYIETLVRDALYSCAERPVVIGKRDAVGEVLITNVGALTPELVVGPLRRVLVTKIDEQRLASPKSKIPLSITLRDDAQRVPYFCSGCPHNTSTVAPDGALVGMGIGCHGMVRGIELGNRGTLIGVTQMGGEGANWIGMAPFSDAPHIFQNIGDGTYFHSGQLAVQAAIASGVSMTYKILYNAAVAMTGGQDATGLLPVPALAAKLRSEGAKEVLITTDDPEKYKGVALADGVSVRHRDDIVEAQEHLATIKGVTVLIHDQQCAAEKRRDRKRGLLPTPTTRVVIDHRICEGCGDCGVQSNCLSLEPYDTEFGRKTRIDQASCNVDASCLKGDCPAFVTVTPDTSGKGRVARAEHPKDIAAPNVVVPTSGVVVRMPGIGGTGVVTVSQLLLAAAKIDGVGASAIDQTGLSQKAGPVVSTVTIGEPTPGRTHVLLALDLLASVTPSNLDGLDPTWSYAVASTHITPTGRMVGNVSRSALDLAPYRTEIDSRTHAAANRYVDAAAMTIGLLGSAVTSNVFVLGVAFQSGLIPLSASSIERAIELNGAAVGANLAAFAWGRQWVVDPESVERAAAGPIAAKIDRSGLESLDSLASGLTDMVAIRRAELTEYQDRKYAKQYVDRVLSCADAERRIHGDGSFTKTVAMQLHRVMAYKDEYEVARLMASGRERVEEAFGAPIKDFAWNLHPPTLRAMGRKQKLSIKDSTRPAFVGLAKMKRIRGTAVDPFGRAEVRREERRLIDDYASLVESLLPRLANDHDGAVRIASLVDQVRGYEDVKLRNLARYRDELAKALAQ